MIVTVHELVAVKECDDPSSTSVVGDMAHPEREKVPVGPPAPFEIESVRFTVLAKAGGKAAKNELNIRTKRTLNPRYFELERLLIVIRRALYNRQKEAPPRMSSVGTPSTFTNLSGIFLAALTTEPQREPQWQCEAPLSMAMPFLEYMGVIRYEWPI